MATITNAIPIDIKGKRFKLPEVLHFEGLAPFGTKHFWRVLDFRAPKKGEYYVSGAVPEAYKAANTLRTEYLIVEPLRKAKKETRWV